MTQNVTDTLIIGAGATSGIITGQYVAPLTPSDPVIIQVVKLLIPFIAPIITTLVLHKLNTKTTTE